MPGLLLPGELDIGKTAALECHRRETEEAVGRAGEALPWRDLKAFPSDVLLVHAIVALARERQRRVEQHALRVSRSGDVALRPGGERG